MGASLLEDGVDSEVNCRNSSLIPGDFRSVRLSPLLLPAFAATALPAAPVEPVSFTGPELQCTLTGPLLDEISGLTCSRIWPNHGWVHQDDEGDARLYRFEASGRWRQTVTVSAVPAEDWEDIASGPLPDGTPCGLFLGDFGDNEEEDRTFEIVILDERDTQRGNVVAPVAIITARHPDRPRNCEALAVSWATGDIFVLTKAGDGRSRLLRLPSAEWTQRRGVVEAEDLGRIDLSELDTEDGLDDAYRVTGADLSPDGRLMAIRTRHFVYVYTLEGEPTAEALREPPAAVLSTASEPQGEAVAFSPGGAVILTASEQSAQVLRFSRRP